MTTGTAPNATISEIQETTNCAESLVLCRAVNLEAAFSSLHLRSLNHHKEKWFRFGQAGIFLYLICSLLIVFSYSLNRIANRAQKRLPDLKSKYTIENRPFDPEDLANGS